MGKILKKSFKNKPVLILLINCLMQFYCLYLLAINYY